MIIITNNEVEVLLNELEIICIEYNKVKKSVMAVFKNREGHSWENVSMVRYPDGKVADLIFEGDSVKKLRQEIKDEKERNKKNDLFISYLRSCLIPAREALDIIFNASKGESVDEKYYQCVRDNSKYALEEMEKQYEQAKKDGII